MRDRLIKSGFALAAGQGINVVRQLALPAAFIAFAGTEPYAEWLVISAGLAQLNLLDFGLQSCAVNRMGMAYHTRDMELFRKVQSSALLMILAVLGVALIGSGTLLFLPVEEWLRLNLTAADARWTMLLLGWGLLAQILLGQIVGVFRAINLAWRGQMWGNAMRLASLIVLVVLLWAGTSFPNMALGMLLVPLVAIAVVLVDLGVKAPKCFPTLTHWDRTVAGEILKPSLFFSLGVLNNFLLFEVPLIILQRTAGASVVVAFSVTRTLMSAGRQLLTPIQHALIPEITRLFAVNDRDGLRRVYRFSIGVALLGGALLGLGLGIGAPGIMGVWLQGKVSPSVLLIGLLVAVSLAAACRESRFLFQFSTNHHERTLSHMTFGYVAMLVASVLVADRFGAEGIAAAWLLTEVVLLVVVAGENRRRFQLFDDRMLLASVCLPFAVLFVVTRSLPLIQDWNAWEQMGIAALAAAVCAAVLYCSGAAPRFDHMWRWIKRPSHG